MAGYPGGLPDNFDPEQFESQSPSLEEVLPEGVPTVLEVVVAKKAPRALEGGNGGVGTITCWRCRQRPDGNWDCWVIDCPPSWPPPTHLKE